MSSARAKAPKSKGAKKVSVHWRLDADVRRVFGAYAAARGEDEGALVTRALRQLVRDFKIDGRSLEVKKETSNETDVLALRAG